MGSLESKADAYRHLFRSIDKIGQLRRNPIVSPLFEKSSGLGRPLERDRQTAQQIRTMLAAVLDDIVASAAPSKRRSAERTRAIILRCDLAGDAHKAVAADLGLSRRQFYRERERSILCAGEAFEKLVERRYPVRSATFNPFAVALQQIAALRNAGLSAGALDLLDRLKRDCVHEEQRGVLTCVQAELLAEHYDYDGALRVLDRMQHADNSAEIRAAADVAYGYVYASAGANASASAHVQRAVETLCGGTQTGNAFPMVGLLPRALLLRCDLDVSSGDMQHARIALKESEEALLRLDYTPPELIVEHLTQQCNLYSLHQADASLIAAAYNRGVQLAQRHGLASAAVNLTLAYSTYHSLQGRTEDASRYARQALEFAQLIPSAQYGSACLIAAEAEISAQRLDQAMQLVRKAASLLRPDGRDYARARMLEAQIECLYGHYHRAVAAGKAAVELARRADCMRFAGASLRIVAEAYAGMDRLREARANIEDALSILESRGHGHSLGRARQVAAQIVRRSVQHRKASKRAIEVP